MEHIKKISIIGVGLIGGSLALAIKARQPQITIVGYSRHADHLHRAKSLNVIDEYHTGIQPAIQGADIIVVAVPLGAMAPIFAQIKPYLEPQTLLTDVGSAKQSVIAAARHVWGGNTPWLVPAHPIAGTEKSGVEAAFATLFQQRRVIITPLPENPPAALDTIDWLWQQTGATLIRMNAAEHDAILAATSHLPHLLAYTLVDTLVHLEQTQYPPIFQFAAGGFRDFTRIAASDPIMWHDICVANQPAICAALQHFQHDLTQLTAAIESGDWSTLLTLFQRAKAARDQFTG